MGFFSKLFGAEQQVDEQKLRQEAESFLSEVEQQMKSNPRAAVKNLLRNTGGKTENLFDYGAPLHERYRSDVLTILKEHERDKGKEVIQITEDELPSVLVLSDEEYSNIGTAMEVAKNSNAELLYIRCPKAGKCGMDTLVALEVQCAFASDPNLLVVYLGECFLMIRSEYYDEISSQFDPQQRFHKLPGLIFEITERNTENEFDDEFYTDFGYPTSRLRRK